MTKYLKFAMLSFVTTFAVLLSSCGDDDEPAQQAPTLVGTWQCDDDAYGDPWDEPLIFVFDSDGSGYQWFSDEPFSYRWEFTYTNTSSRIKIRIPKAESKDLRYELSADNMSLILYGWDNNDMSELWFKRVK